jgi:PAS domain S-box-containing protein
LHKLGAALVVTVVLALLASAWAILDARHTSEQVRRLQSEDIATLSDIHLLALQTETAARHARMLLVTGDQSYIARVLAARAAGRRHSTALLERLHNDAQRRLLARARKLWSEAASEVDRVFEIVRAGDIRSASLQTLRRVEPLREQLADVINELAEEKKAELARRTEEHVRSNDRTTLFTSLFAGSALLCAAVLAVLFRRAALRGSASEVRLRHIFQGAAVAIVEEDYSRVALQFNELRAKGVHDLRAHLAERPELLEQLVALVVIRDLNPAMRELVGMPPDLPLRSRAAFFSAENAPAFQDVLVALWDGCRRFQCETTLTAPNGMARETVLTVSFPEDLQSQPVVVTLTDVSDKKREERRSREALEQSEARLRAVFDQCPVGITMSDLSGTLIYVNPTAQQIMQATDSRVGTRSLDVVTPLDRARVAAWREDFLAGRTSLADLTIAVETPKGQSTLRVQASLLREGSELRGIVSTVEDITERLRLEEQLRQGQKMEAVGKLAGGVAHDFNNLLTVILNGASLLQAGANKDQSALLEQVEAAAERAASLTAQLLAFGRKQVLRPRVVDLNELVSNHCRMLQRIVGEKIQLDARLDPSGVPAEVDPNQIELLLMNLVVNARDAMPLGGQIVIRLENPRPNDEPSLLHLSVHDNGTGIEPGNVPHVFEPFFTTKAVGKGTGLGLATVYGIVEQHHGRIEVETTLGQGTTFHVFLPRAKGAMATLREPAFVTAPDGHETLLLVEDEAAVRQMVAASLARCGYRVLEAESGDAAVELWRSQAASIDLLLTDMVMPGSLSGRELAVRLRSDRPDLKVVYMSGYGAHDLAGEPWSILVQKPFQLSTLAQVLRARLDEKEASMHPRPFLSDAAVQHPFVA